VGRRLPIYLGGIVREQWRFDFGLGSNPIAPFAPFAPFTHGQRFVFRIVSFAVQDWSLPVPR
jgi:hypothetical protein